MDNTTKNIIDGLDHAVRPQDDLFRFVNGTWLASAEIPADQSQTGGFMDLRLEAEANVREIIQDAVAHAEAGEAGDEERKVAVLYDSFMDEGRINGLGASPLADDFALID